MSTSRLSNRGATKAAADTPPAHAPKPGYGNRLLDSLSTHDADRIVRQGTMVELPLGTPLFDREAQPRYAYFLTEGMSSAVFTSRAGRSLEVATIGCEGVTGWISLLGPFESLADSMMQVAGRGYRVPMTTLRREFGTCEDLHDRLLEFAQHQLLVAFQSAACNHLHTATQRFSRWLLMVEDRIGSRDLQMTQEFLANLLGTRRPTMAETASHLQKLGAIQYKRGNVRILKRRLLEEHTCECYPSLRKRFHALYGDDRRSPSSHTRA